MDANTKLVNMRCRLYTREPFYGFLSIGMIWKESDMNWLPENQRRLSTKITSGGIIIYYYKPWVESQSLEQLFGATQHVMDHLVRLHPLRRSGRKVDIYDYGCDMVVNGPKQNPRIGYNEEGSKIILPYKNLAWIPEDWPANETAEFYYDKLLENQENQEEYEPIDSHVQWALTDMSADEVRQLISERARDATEKSCGNIPGHLKQSLESLNNPIVSWQKIIRQFFGTHLGGQRLTYARANRRNNAFGIKGVSHRACSEMVVIVDTSGSISEEELKQFFAEIDAISSHTTVYVLQWDAAFNGIAKYRRNMWKSWSINGGGGTDMREPVKYLEDNGLVKDVVVMFTDGEVNGQWPEKRNFPMLFCITGGTNDLPDWGTVIKLQI